MPTTAHGLEVVAVTSAGVAPALDYYHGMRAAGVGAYGTGGAGGYDELRFPGWVGGGPFSLPGGH